MSTPKGLSPAYVRRVFRAAGFPLTNGGYGNRTWQYVSSVVRVKLRPTCFVQECYCEKYELTVIIQRRDLAEFDSAAEALAYIQRVLAIQVVTDNEIYLRTPARGDLEVIMGGAA